jgi:DNA-binding beta-propeller fold protein YncE
MRFSSTLRLTVVTSLLLAASCGEELVLDPDDQWPTPPMPTVGAAGMVLITNSGDDSVSWIDLTPSVFDQVYKMPVGLLPPEREGPHHGAVAADGRSFFVGLSNYVPGSGSGPHGSHGTGTVPGSLLQYDVATGELIGEARVDRSPGDVRLTPDGTRVVQTHFDLVKITDVAEAGGTIEQMYAPLAIVDVDSMNVALVPACPAPHGVAVSADSKTAYLACWASDELATVELDSHEVKRFHVGTAPIEPTSPTYEPYAVAVHPVDHTVWVSDLKSGDIRIFDPAADGGAGAWDETRGPVAVGGAPFFGQFSSDGKYYFAPVQVSNTFVVIDTATGAVLATLPLAQAEVCRSPHAVLLTPDEKAALVVCEGDHIANGTVAVISLANPVTPTVSKRIEVGVFPDDAFFLKAQP